MSLGLPHFAFFGSRGHAASLLRQDGFARAVRAAGLDCHVFLSGGASDGSAKIARDKRSLEAWLRRLPKPIGVLAADDARALQILAVCKKLGHHVPKSVAVVGVDNDDVFCELADPPLSSVALATSEIGYEAARMLDRLMAGAVVERDCVLVPPATIVPRASSDLPAVLDPDVAATVRYIALHVSDNLQVADVLREVALSRSTLDRRFLRAIGRTPADQIRAAQLKEARHLLEHTGESIERIATAAGYSSAKQFGRAFQRATRMSPTAFRRSVQGTSPFS